MGLGTRFRRGDVVFTVTRVAEGDAWILTADTPGVVGNFSGGGLVPLSFVVGLRSASIRRLLEPGQDEESTEQLRQRVMDSHRGEAFGGNAADYREWVMAVPGVSAVRVLPAHAGPGTVGVFILGADFAPAMPAVISRVQTMLDPAGVRGEGQGAAPIGHFVTVVSAAAETVSVTMDLTLLPGVTVAAARARVHEVVEAYLRELRADWMRSAPLTVRVSQIDSRVLDIDGVVDISDTRVNGVDGNLVLGGDRVPVMGQVVVSA